MIELIIATLGVYGVATIIAEYEGPFMLFHKLRQTKLHSLMSCNVCILPYLALIPTVGMGLGLFGYFAVIGAGVILARLT